LYFQFIPKTEKEKLKNSVQTLKYSDFNISSMTNALIVMAGGAIGSLFRFGLNNFFDPIQSKFPFATLFANAISSFLLGYFIGMAELNRIEYSRLLFLSTGFCGGFSTFSTFSSENVKLMQSGHAFLALIYILISVLIGCLMVYLGWKLTKIVY